MVGVQRGIAVADEVTAASDLHGVLQTAHEWDGVERTVEGATEKSLPAVAEPTAINAKAAPSHGVDRAKRRASRRCP